MYVAAVVGREDEDSAAVNVVEWDDEDSAAAVVVHGSLQTILSFNRLAACLVDSAKVLNPSSATLLAAWAAANSRDMSKSEGFFVELGKRFL